MSHATTTVSFVNSFCQGKRSLQRKQLWWHAELQRTVLSDDFTVIHSALSLTLLLRFIGSLHVPSHLAQYIDFVAGLSEFFLNDNEYQLKDNMAILKSTININAAKPKAAPPKNDIVITPQVLKEYYNVPSGLEGSSPLNIQGIAAFNDYFSEGALATFVSNESLPTPHVTRIGPDCMPSCDQYESDLDIQVRYFLFLRVVVEMNEVTTKRSSVERENILFRKVIISSFFLRLTEL